MNLYGVSYLLFLFLLSPSLILSFVFIYDSCSNMTLSELIVGQTNWTVETSGVAGQGMRNHLDLL